MTGIVAGWYPDSEGVVRWWDGIEWTDHVLDRGVAAADAPPPAEPPEPSGPRRGRAAGLAALVVLVVAGLVLGVVLLVGGDDEPAAGPATTASETAATTEPAGTTTEPVEPTSEAATPTPAPTPDQGPVVDAVAQEFLDAILAVDCPTIERLATPAYLDRQGRCDEDLPDDTLEGATYTREPAAVAGASATVMAAITGQDADGSPGTVFRFTLTLVNTADGWQVNDLAALS